VKAKQTTTTRYSQTIYQHGLDELDLDLQLYDTNTKHDFLFHFLVHCHAHAMKSKTITHCLSLSATAAAPGAGVRKVCEGRLEHLERSRQVAFTSVSAFHILLYVCCYICCYILVTEVLGITSSAGGYYITFMVVLVITITA